MHDWMSEISLRDDGVNCFGRQFDCSAIAAAGVTDAVLRKSSVLFSFSTSLLKVPPILYRLQRRVQFNCRFKRAESSCSFNVCTVHLQRLFWTVGAAIENGREANDVEADCLIIICAEDELRMTGVFWLVGIRLGSTVVQPCSDDWSSTIQPTRTKLTTKIYGRGRTWF